MPAKARSRPPAARAQAAALPRRRSRATAPAGRGELLRRFAPSRRSIVIGLGVLAVAMGGYAVARETSIFAVGQIDVHGGSAQVDSQVQRTLAPLLGRSLVGLDGSAVLRRVDALPTVVSATYDRAFPHTLRISIVPEQPVAVLRSGATAWLVSMRGRVMQPISSRLDGAMTRIWLGAKSGVRVGELLPATPGAIARAVGAAGAFANRVATASLVDGELTFRLRSGIELLLGKPVGIPLKLAIAAKALPALPSGTRFLDLSVPGRPVAGTTVPRQNTQPTSSRG